MSIPLVGYMERATHHLAPDENDRARGRDTTRTIYNTIGTMAKTRGTIVVDTEHCTGCDLCVVACQTDVIELHPTDVNKKGYNYARLKNDNDCIGCISCGLVCPDGCITVYKWKE